MYQQDWMKQVSGAMGPQQGQSPTPKPQGQQMPQKTKFTVDDLKEIMNVIMPAIDYPGPAVRAAQSMLPPGNFSETMTVVPPKNFTEMMTMIPPAPRPRLLPTQQAVVPIGIYE